MTNPCYARQVDAALWAIGNPSFELRLSVAGGAPTLARLALAGWPHSLRAEGRPFGPTIAAGDAAFSPGQPGMAFTGIEAATASDGQPELVLTYACGNGLRARHHLSPAPELPAWRSWTTLDNPTGAAIPGITRFDALNLWCGLSDAEPEAAYLLGWLDGPRAEAPGGHALPYPYPSWIPRLLYGDGAPPPPPPPSGGWASPVLRLMRERLTRLPLRSGKRSTYDNYPWVALRDPGLAAGLFAGVEWSGAWKMDAEHWPNERVASLFACTDGNTHALAPGQALESPTAFIGLFEGDWDDAFNACARYVDQAILPPKPRDFPLLSYNYGCPTLASFGGDLRNALSVMRAKVDAAADAGMEHFMIDAGWWSASPLEGDFSLGLGDFSDHRGKFPGGLRALSDYVHAKGMKFGLWFEFERVDLRTANQGRNPWKPEWLAHQKGHPYRSWCQHVFLLCLGVEAAADWALENVAWAIREYGVDWMKIDSNEWAVCDDPTHGHTALDGEWAHVQGLYRMLRGLRREFPDLIIENCAGGSQRGDFGMARYCDYLACHDTNWPSAINRKYSHGAGCIYPPYYGKNSLPAYLPAHKGLDGAPRADQARLEWRALSRMMALFETGGDLPDRDLANLKPLFAAYKEFRPALRGRRHVLRGPAVLVERENREAGQWEACQYTAPDEALVCAFFFRCQSHESRLQVALKGLDPDASYSGAFIGGAPVGPRSGAQLMRDGVACRLERTRTADVLVLRRTRQS